MSVVTPVVMAMDHSAVLVRRTEAVDELYAHYCW